MENAPGFTSPSLRQIQLAPAAKTRPGKSKPVIEVRRIKEAAGRYKYVIYGPDPAMRIYYFAAKGQRATQEAAIIAQHADKRVKFYVLLLIGASNSQASKKNDL